jgi:hypothetical protein
MKKNVKKSNLLNIPIENDPRFSRMYNDPRFLPIDGRVAIDKKFQTMLDPSFQMLCKFEI